MPTTYCEEAGVGNMLMSAPDTSNLLHSVPLGQEPADKFYLIMEPVRRFSSLRNVISCRVNVGWCGSWSKIRAVACVEFEALFNNFYATLRSRQE
jgi:hypothetical protein